MCETLVQNIYGLLFAILHHKKVSAIKQKLVKSALFPHTQRARERVKRLTKSPKSECALLTMIRCDISPMMVLFVLPDRRTTLSCFDKFLAAAIKKKKEEKTVGLASFHWKCTLAGLYFN